MKRALGTLLAVAALSGSAAANPLQLARFGGLRGDPLYLGPFSLYWNPGAVAQPGWSLGVYGQVAARQGSYERDAVANMVPEEQVAVNSGVGKVQTFGVIPGFAGRFGRTVGPVDVGFGAGVFVDAGGAASWEKNLAASPSFPGAVDGPQRWQSISARLIVVDLAVALAVKHRPSGLSLGLTPMVVVGDFATVRARNIDATTDLVDAQGNPKEGRAYFAGSGVGFSLIAGIRWDIAERWAVGLTYQRGARLDLTGELRVAFGEQAPSTQQAVLKLPIADTVRLGGALGVTKWLTLRPSIEWGIWSVLKEHVFASAADGTQLFVIPRQFSDSFAGRLRADAWIGERVRVMLGFGAEKGATPSRTMEPGFGEGDNVDVGAGVQVALTHYVDLSASFVFHYFPAWTVGDSVQAPTANGTYRDQREYLLLDLEIHEWKQGLR